MQCEFINSKSPLWKSVLSEVRHDFYHRPEYVEICAAEEPLTAAHAVIVRNDDGVFCLPLLTRGIPGSSSTFEYADAVSPYGYSSPLLKVRPGVEAATFLEHALRALKARLLQERIVAVFVRLHPLLPIPLEPIKRSGTLIEHGDTVYLDLRRSHAELFEAMHRSTRQNIQRIRRTGLYVQIDASWSALDEFEEIYVQTMRRVNATPGYFFSRSYFTSIRDALRDCMRFLVVRSGGQIIMGALFSEISGIVQYHLSATRDGFERSGANELCLDFASRWFKDCGNQFLHIGGGVGGRPDSVYRFKSRFSQDRGNFLTWRMIVDPTVYRDLVRRWESEAGITTGGPGEYFPEYRAPMMPRELLKV